MDVLLFDNEDNGPTGGLHLTVVHDFVNA